MKKRLKKKAKPKGREIEGIRENLGCVISDDMIVLLLLLSQMQTVSKSTHQNNRATHLYLKSIKLQSSPAINPIFGMYTIQSRKSYQSGHVVTIANTKISIIPIVKPAKQLSNTT